MGRETLPIGTDWGQSLDQAIDEIFSEMVAVRRHLHMHPEISGEEEKTSLYLYQLLDAAGLSVRLGREGRGVVADSHIPEESPPRSIFALRADIDALRIHDLKEVSYRSQTDGVMHACGHDAHTAVVFGAIKALATLQASDRLPPSFRFRGIFQPAEETCEGAQQMIEVGALDHVATVLATHVDPTRQVGTIGIRAGVLTANCDEMELLVNGHGGHAARPHETSDPIAAAAQLINALYLQIPRVTDSQDAVVLTIGQVAGGENANVIPETVLLRGTLRSLDGEVRRQTRDHICRLAKSLGEMTQTSVEVRFGLGAKSVVNDPQLIALLERSVRDVLGDRGVDRIAKASMGSEDFAFYLNHVPGAMIRLGCRSEETGGSLLHTAEFDVDERALAIGAKVLARTLIHQFLAAVNNHDQV